MTHLTIVLVAFCLQLLLCNKNCIRIDLFYFSQRAFTGVFCVHYFLQLFNSVLKYIHKLGHHDPQINDTQHNDTQHNYKNMTRSITLMNVITLSFAKEPIMMKKLIVLSVVILSIVMLSFGKHRDNLS